MRETIQTKLNEITSVDSGMFIPEAIIEVGTTYFGYEIQSNFSETDFNRNDVMRVSLIGFVLRKERALENTLEIVDEAVELVMAKLKELNFKVSFEDISLQNDIRKVKITGYVYLKDNFVY